MIIQCHECGHKDEHAISKRCSFCGTFIVSILNEDGSKQGPMEGRAAADGTADQFKPEVQAQIKAKADSVQANRPKLTTASDGSKRSSARDKVEALPRCTTCEYPGTTETETGMLCDRHRIKGMIDTPNARDIRTLLGTIHGQEGKPYIPTTVKKEIISDATPNDSAPDASPSVGPHAE